MQWWGMYNFYNSNLFRTEGFFSFPFMVPLLLWSFIWKGLALYRSARNEQKGWFVVLLIVNTVGILEIIYLLFFSRYRKETKKKKG